MTDSILSRYCREIVNAITDGLMVVGKDGKILMANNAMENLTGFPKAELIGEECSILNCDACDKIREESMKKFCMLFEVGTVKGKRCLLMHKSGKYISVVKTASLLMDAEGEVIGAIETFTDITELDDKERKIEELSRRLNDDDGFHGMVGNSPAIRRVFQIIEKAGQSDAPVIVCGESGTGKELVAHAIHEVGRRKNGPFIKFNCAALNESLLESELFGHVKGAFTGAYRHREGRFEAANGGDIFLDEIGDIPLSIQGKLLRVLETKQFERVGDHCTLCVDVRIISATNRDLRALVSQGRFREDLFFRINVVPIHLPPLNKRKEDILLLVKTFIHQLNERSGKNIAGLNPEVMNFFMSYEWPGNIRELKAALEYAFVLAESGFISFDHLPEHMRNIRISEKILTSTEPVMEELKFDDEKKALLEALRIADGNKSRAAQILGVHRMTVWNRMKKHGIHKEYPTKGMTF
jgi:PAS domain S-box-containing protein